MDDDGATLGERHLWAAAAEVAGATGNAARALEILDARLAVEGRAAAKVLAGIPSAEAHLVAGLPRLLLLRARCLADVGRFDDAAETLANARREADAQGARPQGWRIEAEQARQHRLLRQHAQARRAIEAGRVIAAELAALIADAELRRAFERAVDDALPPARPPSARQATKARFDGLTRREVEVAQLVAAGKSNRAIARALQVGERTVESHVAGALAKLGFSSRSRLAAWAVERGLARAAP